jgi:hypothetical protein
LPSDLTARAPASEAREPPKRSGGHVNSEEPAPLRIGHAERTAAQRALDEHLAEGRLSVDEYADRSAIAANAVVAPELAALFTDLPQPHPDLPVAPQATPQPTAAPAASTGGALASTGSGMMGLAVVAAIVLFVLTRQVGVFLLIPLAAGLMWYARR